MSLFTHGSAAVSRQTLIHSPKHKKARKNFITVVVTLIAILFIAPVIATLFGLSFTQFFEGMFVDWFTFSETDGGRKLIYTICATSLASLAFAFAFRAGMFNIGITGQFTWGWIFIYLLDSNLSSVDQSWGAVTTLIIMIATGAFVAGFTAAIKVFLKVNEVVSAILLNWIGAYVLNYLISGPAGQATQLSLANQELTMNFGDASGYGQWIIALVLTVATLATVYVLFRYTVFGKKIISVGLSPTGSKYAGYSTKSIQISNLAISGAIAGLLGAVLLSDRTVFPNYIGAVLVDPMGFNGIAFGLIAMCNPVAIPFVCAYFGFIEVGAKIYAASTPEYTQFIQGLIMISAALIVVFVKYAPYKKWRRNKYSLLIDSYAAKRDLDIEALIGNIHNLNAKYKSTKSQDDLTALNTALANFEGDVKKVKGEYEASKFALLGEKYFLPNIFLTPVVDAIAVKQKNKADKLLTKFAGKKRKVEDEIEGLVSDYYGYAYNTNHAKISALNSSILALESKNSVILNFIEEKAAGKIKHQSLTQMLTYNLNTVNKNEAKINALTAKLQAAMAQGKKVEDKDKFDYSELKIRVAAFKDKYGYSKVFYERALAEAQVRVLEKLKSSFPLDTPYNNKLMEKLLKLAEVEIDLENQLEFTQINLETKVDDATNEVISLSNSTSKNTSNLSKLQAKVNKSRNLVDADKQYFIKDFEEMSVVHGAHLEKIGGEA